MYLGAICPLELLLSLQTSTYCLHNEVPTGLHRVIVSKNHFLPFSLMGSSSGYICTLTPRGRAGKENQVSVTDGLKPDTIHCLGHRVSEKQ